MSSMRSFVLLVGGMVLFSCGVDERQHVELDTDSGHEAVEPLLQCTLEYVGKSSPSEPSVISMSLTNTDTHPVSVLNWMLPFSPTDEKVFAVYLNGQEQPFWGLHVKHGRPTSFDFLTVEPGNTVRAEYVLSEYFVLNKAGTYSVSLNLGALVATYGGPEAAFGVVPNCNVVQFELEEPEALEHMLAFGVESRPRDTSTFNDCSSSQEDAVLFAEEYARTATLWAKHELLATYFASAATYFFDRWFGTYSYNRFLTVYVYNWSPILGALWDGISGGGDYECESSCSGNTIAYVVQPFPAVIHLCPAYFNLEATGIDSRMGTIIHELSHWKGTASDYAYGTVACLSLADSNPGQAVANGDSLEYFHEEIHLNYSAAIVSAVLGVHL